MEECLVLDLGETWVVQEVAEHETTWFVLHTWHLLEAGSIDVILTVDGALFTIIRLFQELLVAIFLVCDSVLSSLLVQLAFHEDVEEHGDSRHVCHLAVDIDSPEERVRSWVFHVRETDQIDCDVA